MWVEKSFYLLTHEELHGSPHGAEHPGDGAVVQDGLGHGLGYFGTVTPRLAHLLPPHGVGEMLGSRQVLHLPDPGLQEVHLDVVLVVDDPHPLHKAGEVADLGSPHVLQLLSVDVLRGPLPPAVGVHGVEKGVRVVDGHLHSSQWSELSHGRLVYSHPGHLEGSHLQAVIDWGTETLLGEALLHLHELLHVGLSPALRVPVPAVQVLLHLLHGEAGRDQQQQEVQSRHLLSGTGEGGMKTISNGKSF